MSKKRKRAKQGGAPAQETAAAADVAASEEVAAQSGIEPEGAIVELAEDEPTRTAARGLGDADAAIAELSEEQPTHTAVRAPLQMVASLDGAPPEPEGDTGYEERFDFGSDTHEQPPEPGSAEAASPRLQSIVESVLFAAERPLSLRQLADLVEESEVERIRAAVFAIEQTWRERGVQLHEVAGGFQFRTHPQNAMWVQKLLQQKPVRLSRALLETLAIVSYRQPITRPEIDEIRGVDSGGTLKTLMDRVLVRILGKKEEPGRPLLYGTTKEFLEFFSLRDLKDLPTLREYHELSEEHQAQVAALEGAAPEGSILPAGEVGDDDATELVPRLSRLEIAAPKEDAAELAEIDRLIRSAGATMATDSDLPSSEASSEAGAAELGDDLVVTGKFTTLKNRIVGAEGVPEPEEDPTEFEEERVRTNTVGEPFPKIRADEDFESEEKTHLRDSGLESSLLDGRDPDKEPIA